ncbi:hypothetical protein ABCR94_30415 [Streptomyces sp. 21So2-11]|uniref:hypothetical protein n=1 Tax=Streptomyces sp. 21So2-11 TaxID=3144408 RepID=UPI0032196C4F
MPALLLIAAVVVVGFEKLAEWRYGPLCAIGALLIAIGIRARSPACVGVGVTVIAMQLTAPAL